MLFCDTTYRDKLIAVICTWHLKCALTSFVVTRSLTDPTQSHDQSHPAKSQKRIAAQSVAKRCHKAKMFVSATYESVSSHTWPRNPHRQRQLQEALRLKLHDHAQQVTDRAESQNMLPRRRIVVYGQMMERCAIVPFASRSSCLEMSL